MTLNKTQKTIIVIAVFFVVAMILYPPWVCSFPYRGEKWITISGNYNFIWSPQGAYPRFIDLYRLSAQLFGVFVIAIGLCLVCSTTKRMKD